MQVASHTRGAARRDDGGRLSAPQFSKSLAADHLAGSLFPATRLQRLPGARCKRSSRTTLMKNSGGCSPGCKHGRLGAGAVSDRARGELVIEKQGGGRRRGGAAGEGAAACTCSPLSPVLSSARFTAGQGANYLGGSVQLGRTDWRGAGTHAQERPAPSGCGADQKLGGGGRR